MERRLLEHNEISDKSYTSKFRPWILKASFSIGEERGLALKVEKHLKKQKSREYLEDIIKKGTIDAIISRYKYVG